MSETRPRSQPSTRGSSQTQLVAGGLTLELDLSQLGLVTRVESAARPGVNLIDRWWCGYTAGGASWRDAPRDGERAFAGSARGASPDDTSPDDTDDVVVRMATPHLRVEKRFTRYAGLPFVRVRYRVETTGVRAQGPGMSLALPALAFAKQLVDPFDLDTDTADDGRELEGGLALPAWRIFADADNAYGVVIFAAERQVMSRLHVMERACAFRPPYFQAYSTEVVTTHDLNLGLQYLNYGPVDEVDWFIGAYDRETWPALLRKIEGFHARRRPAVGGEVLEVAAGAAEAELPPLEALPEAWPATLTLAPGQVAERRFVVGSGTERAQVHDVRIGVDTAAEQGRQQFEVPIGEMTLRLDVNVTTPRPLPNTPDGLTIGAAELAAAGAVGWQLVQRPEIPGGCALVARATSGASPIRIAADKAPHGVYDIYAGVAEGVGLKVKLDEDPYWTYLVTQLVQVVQTWDPMESLCGGGKEVLIRRATLDDGGLSIAPHPSASGVTVLTHLRFAPAPALDQAPRLNERTRFFAGMADIPAISVELSEDSYQEEAWRESLWQHATLGMDTVYWRIDGQCSDFHTKIGTVRYSTPRTHALYSPKSRYYGLALRRLDPLRIAVDEGHSRGLRMFGWMRTNNYSGNVVARFFVEHPEWHDEREDGRPSPSLCLAFPEVRAHKIAILCEAAAYGLDGLLVDTLRHPPIVHYHAVMVAAFRSEYGEDPPREPKTQLDWRAVDNRTGERWERWFRFRARYFTQFFRELRAALRASGLGHLPVHIRVAPHRFLHDGADLEALLDEQLIDGVVANRYVTDALDHELLYPVVRDRVPICAICDTVRQDPLKLLLDLEQDPRLAGIGIYESEWAVHEPEHRAVLAGVGQRMS